VSQTLALLASRRRRSHLALKILGMFFKLDFLIPLILLFLFCSHGAMFGLFLSSSQTDVMVVKSYSFAKEKYNFLFELSIKFLKDRQLLNLQILYLEIPLKSTQILLFSIDTVMLKLSS
jgi:hypothetical protein